jgi:hypothetical protein
MKGLTLIPVAAPQRMTIIPFDKYFEGFQFVSLETTKESLIGRINRLYLFNRRIYILDRESKSIVVFGEQGKFLFRINRNGRGPGEYVGLMDFAIDGNNKRLILEADRPSKLLYFDLDGNFLNENETANYFRNISIKDNQLIRINMDAEIGYHYLTTNGKDATFQKYRPIGQRGVLFQNMGTVFPYSLNSKTLNLTMPYSNIVYQATSNGIIPKYGIDFKDNQVPNDFFDGKLTGTEMIKASFQNHYGFALSNFREGSRFITFSYADNIMVIYDKKNKTSETVNFVKNPKGLNFQNLFGFDGQQDDILSIISPSFFIKQMDLYKSTPAQWNNLPDSIKRMTATVDRSSNPMLLFYHFKD